MEVCEVKLVFIGTYVKNDGMLIHKIGDVAEQTSKLLLCDCNLLNGRYVGIAIC